MSSVYTAKKEGGKGVVGRPLPTRRESRAVWVTPGHQRLLVYTRAPTSRQVDQVIRVFQVINTSSFMPGHQRFLVYTRSSTIPCLYQGRSELFTPVAVVWGVLLRLVNLRRAVSGPFACVAPGRARFTLLG